MSAVETHQQSDPLAGAVLDGRYRVDALIATGGMSGGVPRARPSAGPAGRAEDHGFPLRRRQPVPYPVPARGPRGRAAERPGLVAVYDQGIDGQHPFLVMELVEGGTLRELLVERGPMPPHAVAAVLRPVLGGLAVAHRNGLVHRDVKPENVLISDDGDVKIADFGLVRAIAEAKITSTSVILGTAAYLSPEQVSTGDAEPASDVYAVGILVYELLTGTTPFTGDTRAGGGIPADGPRRPAAQRRDRWCAKAIRRSGAARHRAESGRPVRRRRGHGRRARRDRRRAGAARLPGARAAQLGAASLRGQCTTAGPVATTPPTPSARHPRASTTSGAHPRPRRLAADEPDVESYDVAGQFAGIEHDRVPLGAAARQAGAVVLGGRRARPHRRARRGRMDAGQQPPRLDLSR